MSEKRRLKNIPRKPPQTDAARRIRSGFTLVEVLVAVSIISIAFLAAVSTFNTVTNAIQSTKNRTLATNLAQEKIQILRQISYNRLMVTTSDAYKTVASTGVTYDVMYYPPESILEGGVMYERLTRVQMANEVNGTLQFFGATPDTGMKAVTITVIWTQRGEEKIVQIRSVVTNPDSIKLSSAIRGTVRNSATSAPIEGANVYFAGNIAWRSATDSSGNYTIRATTGTYLIYAEARGYFPSNAEVTLTAAGTTVRDFALTPMWYGYVRGYAWRNDAPVISQVVGSTVNASSGFDQEWVELFNPTTSAWTMSTGPNPTDGVTGIKYRSTKDEDDSIAAYDIPLNYFSTVIPAKNYYLIANTTTINALGVIRTADAVWNSAAPNFPNVIKTREDATPQYAGGGIGVYLKSSGEFLDQLGWTRGTEGGVKIPTIREGTALAQATFGFERDEQFVRKTTAAGLDITLGSCYDSDNNTDDFVQYRLPIGAAPRNSSFSASVMAGKPAIGALVTCDDGLSTPVTAMQIGAPPSAYIFLLNVATGQWNITISSGTRTVTVSSVTLLTDSENVWAPNAATVPTWPSVNNYSAFLTESLEVGYISGYVRNAYGWPISAPSPIKITAGAAEAWANPGSGQYIMRASTGVYTVTANPAMLNPYYVSQSKDNISVTLGGITSGVDFVLSQGGSVSGWVTRDGLNPLPDVAVMALHTDDSVIGVGMSGQDGLFNILNISTGARTIKPELDARETSSPSQIATNVTLGANVFVGTFTVTDAFGKISGSVRDSGRSISTGVMLVASTGTVSASAPPAIIPSMQQLYYMTNSYEDGTYILEVRGGSTLYNIAAFYPTVSGRSVSVSTRTASNISVTPGVTTGGVNFDW